MERAGFGIRLVALLIDGVIFGAICNRAPIGYLLALGKQKRALHNYVAGTAVTKA